MSQFVTMQTQIRDREMLLKALRAMGYRPVEGERVMKDWLGSTSQRQRAEIVIPRLQLGLVSNDLGFRQENGIWTMVISRYDMNTRKGRQFQKQVEELEREFRRQYALQTVMEKSEEQGFNVVEQQEQEDGTIRVVVRRWS